MASEQENRNHRVAELQRSITRIYEACQVPPLPPSEYQLLFTLIAAEVRENGFAPDRSAGVVVTRAAAGGLKLSLKDVSFVIKAVEDIDPWFEHTRSPSAVARAYRDYVLARCSQVGADLTDDEYQLIQVWFGASQWRDTAYEQAERQHHRDLPEPNIVDHVPLQAEIDENSESLSEPSIDSILVSIRRIIYEGSSPNLPKDQEPGLQFSSGEHGKIHISLSGLALSGDLVEIAAMRGVIIEALDDLTTILEGSNAYATVARIAQRYKATIIADAVSIDQLFGYGVRLENCRARLEREIQSGDYPDLAVPAGEALDSVIALHGPMISSTARGQELAHQAINLQHILRA